MQTLREGMLHLLRRLGRAQESKNTFRVIRDPILTDNQLPNRLTQHRISRYGCDLRRAWVRFSQSCDLQQRFTSA